MKLKVLPATRSKQRDCFVVKMEFSHCDLNAHSNQKFELKTQDEVVDVLNMLLAV